MKINLHLIVFILCLIVMSCKKTATEPEITPTPTTPVVKIISLTNNSVVLDSALIEVDATDDKGIMKVEIYIDNKTDSLKTLFIKPYKYTWLTPQTEDSSKHLLYVKAYDADGNVTTTEVWTINVQKFQLPSQLQIVSMTDEVVKLKWKDNSTVETGFDVEMSIGANNYTLIKSVGPNTDSVEIAGTYTADSTYYFRVKAKINGKIAVSSAIEKKLILSPPTLLAITSMTTTQVSLSWNDNSTFEKGFEIEQSTNGGSFSLIKTVGANITTTTISNTFEPIIIYSFRVRSVTTINKSSYSNAPTYKIAPQETMVIVIGETSTMGSENNLDYGASPSHSVTLSDFYLNNTETRWESWDSVYQWGKNNGYTDLPVGQKGYTNGNSIHPVTNVNWYDVLKWCNARSQKEGLTPVYYTSTTFTTANIYKTGNTDIQNTMVNWSANGYRLPTEAEWEYAAKGGSKRQNPPNIYSGSNTADSVAWTSTNTSNTHQVATKLANELGLYDMSGNVYEWCWDWYGTYSNNAQINPYGTASGTFRIVRGGSFYYFDGNSRVSYRVPDFLPNYRHFDFGFRCCRTK